MSDEIDNDKPLTRAEVNAIIDEKFMKLTYALSRATSSGVMINVGFLYEFILYLVATDKIDIQDLEIYWNKISESKMQILAEMSNNESDHKLEIKLRKFLMSLLKDGAEHFSKDKNKNSDVESED